MFRITDVSIEGGATVSHEKVRDAVWTALEGDQYLLISKQFMYLYPQEEIQTVVSDISRVHDVEVSRDKKTLHVSFEEYIPYALWCESDDCVFLTQDGYGFDTAPSLEGNIFVRYVTETASTTPHTQALSTEAMAEATSFISAVQSAFGFHIVRVVYTRDGDVVYYRTDGAALMTSPDEPSLKKLETILTSEEFAHLITAPFEYIDVRFGNRVFVKEE